jgi:RNA polymerase sigma-70 factor (ECF subfamily)
MDVAQCVRQARRGSQRAFASLYGRFSPLVHSIQLGRFPPSVADDLTQECFTTAFMRLEQLHDDAKFGPWIAAIARRMRPPADPTSTTDHALDQFSHGGTPPEEVAEAARMFRAIATLPEAYRETLLLRLVEGMSGPEIAALTGLTPQSVRVNLHRGMAKLRDALGLRPQPDDRGDPA